MLRSRQGNDERADLTVNQTTLAGLMEVAMSERKREDGLKLSKLILEIRCLRCKGKGRVPGYPDPPCAKCDGSGYIPTKLGRRILALVRMASSWTTGLGAS